MTVGRPWKPGTAISRQRNGNLRRRRVAKGRERELSGRRPEGVEAQLLRDSVTKVQPRIVR